MGEPLVLEAPYGLGLALGEDVRRGRPGETDLARCEPEDRALEGLLIVQHVALHGPLHGYFLRVQRVGLGDEGCLEPGHLGLERGLQPGYLAFVLSYEPDRAGQLLAVRYLRALAHDSSSARPLPSFRVDAVTYPRLPA
ncbi:MAG: hypothetical protein RX318_01870 [bacterium]|nr:hypothetical protein [bacterium]